MNIVLVYSWIPWLLSHSPFQPQNGGTFCEAIPKRPVLYMVATTHGIPQWSRYGIECFKNSKSTIPSVKIDFSSSTKPEKQINKPNIKSLNEHLTTGMNTPEI